MRISTTFLLIIAFAFTAFGQKSSGISVEKIVMPQSDGSFSFSGYVEGTNGPVRNARVILTRLNGNSETYYTQTNSFGFFRFINKPTGSYSIYASTKRRVYPIRIIPVDEFSTITPEILKPN